MKGILFAMALATFFLLGIGGTVIQGKSIKIDMDTFPDDTFREYVGHALDTNQNGKLSAAERNAVKEIYVNEYLMEFERNTAFSVKGIEYFPNLEKLNCSENMIEKLDISKNKNLKVLVCEDNYIKKLDVSKNKKLKRLYCGKNNLKKIDISKNRNLQGLDASRNQISKINISKNTKLRFLDIGDNKIKYLDLKKQKKLEGLWCGDNKIKKLNLKYNKDLITISCEYNKIEKLDVAHLSKLDCLYCSNNRLTKLDLSNNKLITALTCDKNSIISGNLHVSPTQLEYYEYNNQERTIKVKKLGKYYYVPIKNFNRTNKVTELSAGEITDKGIRLKGKEIPKKITYQYNMFVDGDKVTNVTIMVKK